MLNASDNVGCANEMCGLNMGVIENIAAGRNNVADRPAVEAGTFVHACRYNSEQKEWSFKTVHQ